MPEFQVHVHIHGKGHAIAFFPTMESAYRYMIDKVTDILLFTQAADADWVDDEMVKFVDAHGNPLATMLLVHDEPLIVH